MEDQITIEQAIEISGKSRKTIERAKAQGEISCREIKEGRVRRMVYSRAEILDWAGMARVQPAVMHDETSAPTADATSLVTQRRAATERHVASRSVKNNLAKIDDWYEQEGKKIAERQHALWLQSERLADALDRVAAAQAHVLSLAEARAQFRLSEKDLKAGADAGAITIRRGARGARTVLRAHVAAWAETLYGGGNTCA